MNQRQRMLKTLAALVVAMTAATWLLGQLDGRIGGLTTGGPADRILMAARNTVGQVDARDGWIRVDVVAADEGGPGRLLAGRVVRAGYHFRVDVDGRVAASADWRAQREVSEPAGSVVIHCDRSAGGTITTAQWLAVKAIAASLPSPERSPGLPIRLDTRLANASR